MCNYTGIGKHAVSGVSRISFGGGGGSKYFCKIAACGEATRLLGASGACSPEKILKQRCNLVRFGEYFAKIL